MVTEEQKYKAYTFNFGGFAMMAPFGKLWLDFYEIIKNIGLIGFIIYSIIAFGLLIVGLAHVEKGRAILSEKRKSYNAD